jgi:peptidoglycan hydrolase-like protein with peptidoglycan-binding domain
LTAESTGDDVRALQEELRRLGAPIKADGVVGRNTIVAAAQAFARIGVTIAPDSVPAASVLWLPNPAVSVSQCELPGGVPVDQGATMATFAPTSPRVAVIDPPSDLVPGSRVAIVGEVPYAVDDEGIVDVPDLSVLGAAGNVDVSASEVKPIDARLALSEPVQVSVVVPSAVFGVDGVRGCVSSRGDRYPVEILGSQLGETIVVFPDGKRPERVDTRPDSRSSCP